MIRELENGNKIRELAYIVKIDNIESIEGSDNCEAAIVGGWKIMTKKNTFKVGDYAVYFEIDSKVPETKEFEFLAKKHYKIKTQKYTFGGKGNFISQGLLMSLNDFTDETGRIPTWVFTINTSLSLNPELELPIFLTKTLGVTYSVAEDNKRKSNIDKYTKMKSRYQKLFAKNKIVKWLYERKWGKKLLFLFLGKKSDKRGGWPQWVRKTDEERVQNLPQLFPGDNTEWIVTEKIDGSSTTFTMKRKKGLLVCSRNVCFDKPEKTEKCYYDTNIYLEMANKYNIESVLKHLLLQHKNWIFVTIQGETFGAGVQKRTYGLIGHEFMAFNLIYGTKENEYNRMNSIEMTKILQEYKIPCVPILDEHFKIPQTIEEMIKYADGKSKIDNQMREGVVLRTYDGKSSFKSVSNDFLIKFHQ